MLTFALPSPRDPSVNLAEAGSTQHVANPCIELFAPLDEPYPSDPGEPSGARLRILGSGEITALIAEIGSHYLGWLDELAGPEAIKTAVRDLRRGAAVRMPEVYGDGTVLWSGAELKLVSRDEPELSLSMGTHCFGTLRGNLLATFLDALSYRIEDTRA